VARYLFQGTYSTEGVQGLLREGGSRRRAAVERLVQSLGGRLEAFYYGFGAVDLYMIVDLPDHAAAAAASLVVGATGAGRWRTVVLLTAEDIDEAASRAPEYRAPGHERLPPRGE
jgi:uncharacterized protein with GYD domain